MPTELKPGAMGSAADGGTPAAFADSMAEAIEDELNQLLAAEGLPQLKVDDNSRETRDRRRLLVAIARGILHHLDHQRAAITVERGDGSKVSPQFAIKWS